MKRILIGWPISRIMYLLAGLFFILAAVNDRAYWLIPFGLYLAAMALFRFGCAGSACKIPTIKDKI